MEILVALLLALIVLVIVLAAIGYRRRQDLGRDDLKRAGDDHALSPEQAALRGGGKSAWMRPGNFGA